MVLYGEILTYPYTSKNEGESGGEGQVYELKRTERGKTHYIQRGPQ